MKVSKKIMRDEIKRMQVSFEQLKNPKSKKINFDKCLKCKQDAGKNFTLVYKKNKELKGKICISCNNLSKKIIN